ncbi:hypothetical protein BCR42DRAFT_414373 [Absidia repens]|uniref:CAP-Gly domain-containing protein n=1 Tax=Absidia repens TaxID=90262 RepID=A0A1X2IJ20_9FUNG|nr:hypothetical protein BCR42DRAFT_414373 [Absidia repens]
MSALPRAPSEFNLLRKRNDRPLPSRSTMFTSTDRSSSVNSPKATRYHHNTVSASQLSENDYTADNDAPSIGDRVLVEGKQLYGTLRFLGPTEFKSGIWAGLELDHPGTGKNDGSVQGVYYFTCPSRCGIFVLASKIILVSRKSVSIPLAGRNTHHTRHISPLVPPSQHSSSIRKSQSLKNIQYNVSHVNVAPPSPVDSERMGQEYKQNDQQQQILEQPLQQKNFLEETPVAKHAGKMNQQHQQEINDYQIKLGREQHKVYELQKERDQMLKQIQQSKQKMVQQQQLIQQWYQSQAHMKQLEESNRQQKMTIDQLDESLENARSTHTKESNQLLEQQSQLIQELQRERLQHDASKSKLRLLEQACQSLMDPFDVRPGLELADQLKETQRQVKELLEKVRLDTEQKNQHRRDTNALQRDVANLESLIEAKVFKEEDLMESLELERQYNQQLRNELKQVKKNRRRGEKLVNLPHKFTTSTNNNNSNNKKYRGLSIDSGVMMVGPTDPTRWTVSSGETSTTYTSSLSGDDDDDDDDLPSYCEICETVGHDLMSCLHVVMDPSSKTNYNPTMFSTPHMDTTPILQHKMLPSM